MFGGKIADHSSRTLDLLAQDVPQIYLLRSPSVHPQSPMCVKRCIVSKHAGVAPPDNSRYDYAMTKYIDIDGREWPSAQLALDEFLNDLPSLSENEYESLCQYTLSTESPAFNLRAFKRAIEEDDRLQSLFEGYPVPHPLLAHAQITPSFQAVNLPTKFHCQCGMIYFAKTTLDDHIVDQNAADLAGEDDPMRGIPATPTNYTPS